MNCSSKSERAKETVEERATSKQEVGNEGRRRSRRRKKGEKRRDEAKLKRLRWNVEKGWMEFGTSLDEINKK